MRHLAHLREKASQLHVVLLASLILRFLVLLRDVISVFEDQLLNFDQSIIIKHFF